MNLPVPARRAPLDEVDDYLMRTVAIPWLRMGFVYVPPTRTWRWWVHLPFTRSIDTGDDETDLRLREAWAKRHVGILRAGVDELVGTARAAAIFADPDWLRSETIRSGLNPLYLRRRAELDQIERERLAAFREQGEASAPAPAPAARREDSPPPSEPWLAALPNKKLCAERWVAHVHAELELPPDRWPELFPELTSSYSWALACWWALVESTGNPDICSHKTVERAMPARVFRPTDEQAAKIRDFVASYRPPRKPVGRPRESR